MKGSNGVHQDTVQPYIGEQGLARLVSRARNEYHKEVLGGRKSYQRYAVDFISSIVYHDAKDALSRNSHHCNVKRMEAMLADQPFAVHYFEMKEFSNEAIEEMIRNFFLSSPPPPSSHEMSEILAAADVAAVQECPSKRDYASLIVHCANKAGVFVETLDDKHIDAFFAGNPISVRSKNNKLTAFFFDYLATSGVIIRNWQKFIADHELIISSGGTKRMEQGGFSTPLSRINEKKMTDDVLTVRNIIYDSLKDFEARFESEKDKEIK